MPLQQLFILLIPVQHVDLLEYLFALISLPLYFPFEVLFELAPLDLLAVNIDHVLVFSTRSPRFWLNHMTLFEPLSGNE